MITVYPVLRQLMREKGINFKELADIANMSRIECCLSLLGIRQWKLTEAVNICCFFCTENLERTFVRNHFKTYKL
jgi:hypothetical protein